MTDCTNCSGRGHFRDPEDQPLIDERNYGMFGQCRDCLGSGDEPERCEHGVSKLGRDYRVARNLCIQCLPMRYIPHRPATAGWERGRWWRAIGPDGEVWAESSDEEEVRELARPTDTVQNLWEKREQEWRDA